MSPQTRILYNDLPSAVNEIVLEVYRHLKYISWFSILSLKSMKVLYPPRRKLFQNIAGSQYNEDDPLSTSLKRTVHWTPKCKVYFFNKLLSIWGQCINLRNHLLVSPDIFSITRASVSFFARWWCKTSWFFLSFSDQAHSSMCMSYHFLFRM